MVESSHPPEVTDDAASRSPAEELLPAKVPLSMRWLHTHTHHTHSRKVTCPVPGIAAKGEE